MEHPNLPVLSLKLPKITVLDGPPDSTTLKSWSSALLKRTAVIFTFIVCVTVWLISTEGEAFREFTLWMEASELKFLFGMGTLLTGMISVFALFSQLLWSFRDGINTSCSLNLDNQTMHSSLESRINDEDEGIPLLRLLRYVELEEIKQYLLTVKKQGRSLTVFECRVLSQWYDAKPERDRQAKLDSAKRKIADFVS